MATQNCLLCPAHLVASAIKSVHERDSCKRTQGRSHEERDASRNLNNVLAREFPSASVKAFPPVQRLSCEDNGLARGVTFRMIGIVGQLTEGNGGRLEPTCVDLEQRMHFLVGSIHADFLA